MKYSRHRKTGTTQLTYVDSDTVDLSEAEKRMSVEFRVCVRRAGETRMRGGWGRMVRSPKTQSREVFLMPHSR